MSLSKMNTELFSGDGGDFRGLIPHDARTPGSAHQAIHSTHPVGLRGVPRAILR